MKKLYKIIFFLFVFQSSFAQEIAMLTDWDKARQIAKEQNKRILIILTGSEWCAPCKKMDKNVIQNNEFQNYVSQNLIVFLVDIPGNVIDLDSSIYKKYQKFEEKYETKRLPSLVLTESDGMRIKVLNKRLHSLKNVMKQLKS